MTNAARPSVEGSVEPVVRTIVVNATPARAFDVFTSRMTAWWPPTHSVSSTKSPIAEVVVEPRAGGRWYERGEDGSECTWGHVITWSPPGRILLAWQLNAEWQFDADLITEVEVLFQDQGQNSTLVRLEHRKLEAFGDAAESVRTAISSPGGWGKLLEAYANAVA